MKVTPNTVETYFRELYRYLIDPRNRVPHKELLNHMPVDTGPGVYFIFDKRRLCYVGESGNLYKRFSDFNRTVNHSFRRSLGARDFSTHIYYAPASATRKFHAEIETLLDTYCMEHISVSYKRVLLGRLEFEEWITGNEQYTHLLNKKTKRL